jgi:hypothetical protein
MTPTPVPTPVAKYLAPPRNLGLMSAIRCNKTFLMELLAKAEESVQMVNV